MKAQRVDRRRFFLPALYIVAILVAYLYPVNTEQTMNRVHVLNIRGDHWLHLLLFFPLPFLVCPAGKSMRACLLPILLCFCIAAAAEGIHYFLPYRSFNPFDMLANVTGVLLAALLLLLVRIRYAKK